MKNILISTILFSCIAFCVSAQSRCGQGSWFFGISPGNYSIFNKGNWTYYLADTINHKNSNKTSGFSLGYNFGAGYFFKDNFCLGAGLYGSSASTLTSLFARYYLLKKDKCVSFTRQDYSQRSAFFIQGLINWGYSSQNSESIDTWNNNPVQLKAKDTNFNYGGQAAIGYTYMIRKKIAMELLTLYSTSNGVGNTTNFRNGIALPKQKVQVNHSILSTSIGIQIYFN